MKLKRITKRAVILLLAVVLLTGCLIPHAANNETAHETGGVSDPLSSTTSSYNALPELYTSSTVLPDPEALAEAEAAYRERMQRECAENILADSKIADYVNTDEFFETKPMFRLTALETLNSYVVQNADDTNTVYLMAENVKYVDAKGEIREKDIRLSTTEKGFEVTDSDVKLLLPAKVSSGISVNTDFGTITLTPMFRGDNIAKLNEKSNSVRYDGAFGNGTVLHYTPTLSGVKEDIVLEAKPESNTFKFLLEADGLTLYTEDGIYYLVSAENKDCRIRFDQIFIYDANGRFTAGETEIIDAGHGRYTLTVTAPREFLDAAETTYPVTINPNLSVLTESNSADIIDAAVYANQPNMNAGTWQYNNIGYTDSTYGLARTVVKLSGLLSNSTYQNLTADKITNMTFSAMEATGNSSKTVKIHPITGTPTWTETSVTWNNYGTFDNTVNYGGTTLTGDQFTHFNITNLVKAWKNGSYDSNGCFIFIMGGTENSESRALYATEYSGTSNRPYLSMTYQSTVSIDTVSIYVTENGIALPSCVVSPPGTYNYSWSINNTAIATCINMNYQVTQVLGIRAGNTNLTVTVTDTSNNTIGSAAAFVFVLIPDGIFKIENGMYNGKFFTSGKTLPSQQLSTFLNMYSFSGNDPVTDQITQMWRIKHVVYNIYSIRPYFKLDMRLGKGNNYAAVTDYIEWDDSYNLLYSDYLWWITRDLSDRFIIQCDGTTRVLNAEDWQNGTAPVTVKPDTNLGLSARWYLINVTATAPTGMYLYDTETDSIVTNATVKYIAPDETRELSDIGIIPVAYASDIISQTFEWYSGVIADATVTADGDVTGVRSTGNGYVGIFVRWDCQAHSNITSGYWLKVLEIPNGLYFLKNKKSGKYADIQSQEMVNGKNIHQWTFHGYNSQRWIVTRTNGKYYTIQSANSHNPFYLSSSGNTYNDNVVLRTGSITSGKLWTFIKTGSGSYKILSKCSSEENLSFVLAVENGSANNGGNIHQSMYIDNTDYRDEWEVEIGYNTFYLDAMYDQAYLNRFSNAETRINNAIAALQQKYLEEFGIEIIYNDNCYAFYSYADNDNPYYFNNICDHSSNCENSFADINGNITLKSFHHTNAYNILYRIPNPVNSNKGNIAFIGHQHCIYYDNSKSSGHRPHPFAGLSSPIHRIISILCFSYSPDEEIKVIVHEFGHLYGAPDHYDGDYAPSTATINAEFHSNSFNRWCIYGEDKDNTEVVEGLIICDGCRAIIESNAGKYNLIEMDQREDTLT